MKKTILIALAAAAALAAAYAAHYRFSAGMDPYEVVRKLQGLRMAVEIFRQSTGHMPAGMDEVIRSGALEAVPELKLKRHPPSSEARNVGSMEILDTGSWAYVGAAGSPYFGRVFIDCSHMDGKGRVWSEF